MKSSKSLKLVNGIIIRKLKISLLTETAIEYVERNLSKCINKSVSNVTEHDDLNAQTSELYV